MSSRSFRRRNSRRRRQGMAGGPPGGNGTPGSHGPDNAPGSAGFQVEKPPRPAGYPQRGPSGGRRPGGRPAAAPAEPVIRSIPIEVPDCPLCGKPVRDLAAALTHKVSRRPAHFDCVLKELRESNEVAPQERICYLGGGSFGILEFRPPGSPNRFVIRKKIPYEEKESPQEWKKPLVVTC